jgi:hypothetical protein
MLMSSSFNDKKVSEFESNALQVEVQTLPASVSSFPTEPSSVNLSTTVAKDPFKEFLEKKQNNLNFKNSDSKIGSVPDRDPFRAKLEEQNAAHSAVSPFGK